MLSHRDLESHVHEHAGFELKARVGKNEPDLRGASVHVHLRVDEIHSADKFAPAARRLEIIAAQRFGGEAMEAIPLTAVQDAVERMVEAIVAKESLE